MKIERESPEMQLAAGGRNFDMSIVLYQEGDCWIAQVLEYDICVQARSITDLRHKLTAKLATEVVISMDLDRAPLQGIAPAPQKFWRMYEAAKMTVDIETPPVRIVNQESGPRFVPSVKIGQLELA